MLDGYGFDPNNPGALSTANKIGNISAPRTQEALIGVDREVMPNLGISATYTYRYMNNFLWNVPIGATRADYVQTRRLHGHLRQRRQRQRPLLRADDGGGGGGQLRLHRPEPSRLPPALHELRAQCDQADVQSLDGPHWVRDDELERVLRRG